MYTPDRCAAAPRAPAPTTGCTLDLRGLRAGDPGTCGAELAAGSRENFELLGAPIEVDALTQLPIVIDLPEGAHDTGCATLCARDFEPSPPLPTFGVRIALTWPPAEFRFASVRVDPPWFVVAGNEGDPTLCHDGWPTINEFGEPLACVFSYLREIDVITFDPAPGPALLTITSSDESNEWSNCCLYPTE